MENWRTAIVNVSPENFWIRGYSIGSLMEKQSFAGTIFLLQQGRLPTEGESRLLDAILISASDHGPAAPSAAAARLVCSGNRAAVSAAVAAGVLAIGLEHGGAGQECMEMIADGLKRCQTEGISVEQAAVQTVDDARAQKSRLPGLGHRTH